MTLHTEVLGAGQQLALTAAMEALSPSGALLAGGLALALRFGHRRSHDMDWFLPQDRNTETLARELSGRPEVTLIGAEPGTIHGHWGDTPFSIIRYRYRLVGETIDDLPLADLRTLADMKLLAALNRGTRRDFIDLAACLQHGPTLSRLLDQAVTDIPGTTRESLLRGLAYFDDAELEPDPEGLPPDGWKQAKQTLVSAIRGYLAQTDHP